jgi:hypothetical protein
VVHLDVGRAAGAGLLHVWSGKHRTPPLDNMICVGGRDGVRSRRCGFASLDKQCLLHALTEVAEEIHFVLSSEAWVRRVDHLGYGIVRKPAYVTATGTAYDGAMRR